MNKLRVAVIGAGHLGRIHARLLAAAPQVHLTAVADSHGPARTSLAAELGCEAVENWQLLLGRIDAAVVAAPTRVHHAIAATLLNEGVHLLVEKPLAATTAEADDLVARARRGRAVLQVGHVERFNPAFVAALPHLQHAKYFEACRHGRYSYRSTDIGVVLDLMVHDLELVLSAVGCAPRSVSALGMSVVGREEDVAQARVEFENGAVANFSASRVSHQAQRRLHAWTDQGFAEVDLAAREARVAAASEALSAGRLDPDLLAATGQTSLRDQLKGRIEEEHLPLRPLPIADVNPLQQEQQDFLAAVASGREPTIPGEQGRNAVALAEWILAEIDAHSWDGHANGRFGPRRERGPVIIPAPHFKTPTPTPARRREAG